MALDIKGSSFAGRYKRVNGYSIDSTDVWETLEEARVYARNTDTEPYVPYAGQVVSVIENGTIYKLVKDDTIPETDGKEHFKLAIIGSNSDNDDRYVRKDIAETIEKLMTFLEGINAKGTSTLEQIKLVGDILSSNFATGSTGFGIYKDEQGNYHLDIDFVDIRKRLNVESLQVNQATYVGGKQYNSDGIICNKVEDKGTFWRCYFRTTDAEGRIIYNPFAVDDLANCETFNLKSGNHYYWRAVVGIGDDFIDLSKNDCISGSDDPLAGDNIVHLGNKTNPERQGTILWDSVTAGGPYIRIYKGINSYTMPEPLIDLNTVLSEITAKFKSEATGKDIDDILDETQTNLDLIKEQTDKEYTLWFFDYDPTLENLPASDWTTDELKTMHEQDMFYNRLTGHGYRFEKDVSSWSWNDITDHLTLKALEDASKAQDTADGKRRVFVSQPKDTDAYDAGDMWVNATYSGEGISYKNDSLVCITAKAAGTAFSIKHWQPSSTATTAYLENLGDRILASVTDSEDGIEAAKRLANQGISDAYDAAQDALNALGIARGAQETADKNTAVIQVTKDSIAALVEGIHFDNSGNITNINTSGLVTTDDFNTLLSKKITFDAEGHVSNISTSGLVTEASFTHLFSEQAASDGYVKKAYIDLFVTENENGTFQSNAIVSADKIDFKGGTVKISAENIDFEGADFKINADNINFEGAIIEEINTLVSQSAKEWKIEVMGKDENGNPNSILAAINATEEGIKIKGNKVEIDGNLLADVIKASGLNIDDKFKVNKDGTVDMLGRFSTSVNGKRILIDPGSGSLTMYNEKDLIVAEISFKTPDSASPINSSFTKMELFNYDASYALYEHSIITPGGVSIESRQFPPDRYSMNIDPYGITFRKNRTVTNIISNE